MSVFSKICVTRQNRLCLGVLVACVFFLPAVSVAQSSRDINNRLNRLENELETLNRAVYRGEQQSFSGGGDAGVQANTEVRLQQLEVELRDIRGKIEEQSYEIRQMRSQLDRALSDMELRMNDLEGSGNKVSGGVSRSAPPRYTTGPSSPSPKPLQEAPQQQFTWSSTAAPSNTVPAAGGQLGTISQPENTAGSLSMSSADKAAATYENAFSLLKSGKYDAAALDFSAFLEQYPNHVLAGNAKYWLGETFYVRGDYEHAARIFAEGYQKSPKGGKAPDNLLKLGMSLAGMGNKEDACVALGQLGKEFPSGASPVLRRANQEMTRIGCI